MLCTRFANLFAVELEIKLRKMCGFNEKDSNKTSYKV